MIRQAVSCDICGAEKKQTNHWFVAYEQAGELRVSGWSTRNRLRAGSKHLCGQACLHKLADDFMARVISGRTQRSTAEEAEQPLEPATDTSLLNAEAAPALESESSARLLTPVEPPPQASLRAVALMRIPERGQTANSALLLEDHLRVGGMRRREEAWRRERERTMRASERR